MKSIHIHNGSSLETYAFGVKIMLREGWTYGQLGHSLKVRVVSCFSGDQVKKLLAAPVLE